MSCPRFLAPVKIPCWSSLATDVTICTGLIDFLWAKTEADNLCCVESVPMCASIDVAEGLGILFVECFSALYSLF